MPDDVYCYPSTNVLKNKLNIKDSHTLFEAEKELTFIRLQELQNIPVKGKFDFTHLQKIHKYIFQDIYDWAGKIRTVEIGKGNLFCTTRFIESYAKSVFDNYYSQCIRVKNNKPLFIEMFAKNYADLNALHPFREGNGRTQREFARLVCLECGYIFDLSQTTHKEMLEASRLSFDKGDNRMLCDIFQKIVISIDEYKIIDTSSLQILTSDDLIIEDDENYYKYYSYDENTDEICRYDKIYEEKTMDLKQLKLERKSE